MKTIFKLSAIVFLMTAFAFNNVNAQISVSGGTGLSATYTSFTKPSALFTPSGLFAAINATPQTGNNIVVTVTGDIFDETGTHGLGAGTWASITITPSGPRTVSGNVTLPILTFGGADNVTIDGLNTGGNSLTIQNINSGATPGTSTIRFLNGASNNVITNCAILGSFSGTLATDGGNIFFNTDLAGGSGNDNNTISNCDIGPTIFGTPTKLIYGNGSTTNAAIRNSGNLIDNNNLFDCFRQSGSNSAIYILSGNDNWTISNNRIYQTAARTFTSTGLRYSGIVINGGSTFPGMFTITGNKIGFANSSGTGATTITGSSNEVRGIDLPSVDPTVATSIQGNIISGINQTTSRASTLASSAAFIGIGGGYTTDGKFNIGNISGNQIGSTDGSSVINIISTSTTANTSPAIGIYEFGDGSSNVSNNQIGNIIIGGTGTVLGFRGIFITTVVPGTLTVINENVITDITNTQIGAYGTIGILVNGKAGTVYKNTVQKFLTNANSAGTVVLTGILLTTTVGAFIVEKNDVHFMNNICNNANLVANYGYDFTFVTAANEVRQNYCYGLNITASNTSCQIFGIHQRGGVAITYNNMVTLGLQQNGTSITTPFEIRGLSESENAGVVAKSYFYNSVYITGSGVAPGGSNTYSLFSISNGTRTFTNNILVNDRNNSPASGIGQYAIRFSTLPGYTSNYNNLISSGTNGAVGFFGATQTTLADWQTATGQDANSSNVAISFMNPLTGNLDLDGVSIGDKSLIGTPIAGILTDIHKNLRDTEYPYMGANEASPPLPVELASFTSSVNGNNVTLNWSTASETNNSGFDIEKTLVNGNWSKIGNVTGSGTTTSGKSYSFTDNYSASGKFNYRLKQIDFNGNFEYFNLSNEVNIGVPSDFNLSQNYPNPFNPTTNLEFGISELGLVTLKIYDISGKEVMTLVNEQKAPGYYIVSFNGANLSSGIYFYTLNSGNFVATKKMTLIK